MKLKAIGSGAVLILTALLFMPSGTASGASVHGACQKVSLPVALASGQPTNQKVSGTLCTPNEWASGNHSVDLSVHGGTYNSNYWDFQFDHPKYSYVDRALERGRATFAYDRLGVGESSRPLSALATLQADAHILHQLIGWLRTSKGYQDVTLIGHSLGSAVSLEETATYNDADRVILTGYLNTTKLQTLLAIGTATYPAMLDPQFVGTLFDPGYLTLLPGKHQGLFYASTTDPAAIAYDEAHKDVMSATEVAGLVPLINTPAPLNKTQQISRPLLLQVGQEDALFCGGTLGVDCSSEASVFAHEMPYYTNAESLNVSVVPDTGHNLPMHPSVDDSFAAINDWIETH